MKAYQKYVLGKQTLHQLSHQLGKSPRTLQRHFEQFDFQPPEGCLFDEPVNLVLDATFFSRSDGVLVFRANGKNIYWRFIQSETMQEVTDILDILDKLGYCFASVTLDGRKGMIKLF